LADERSAARATLARLRAEIGVDRTALAARQAEAAEVLAGWGREPPDKAQLALAAVALHGWYTGLETVCERVARDIDGDVPRGDSSHRTLLSQAMTELDGLRPAVIPRELEPDLLELLAFRHFFRHAYAVDVDPDKVQPHLRRLGRLATEVDSALEDFDRFLAAAASSLPG
jgi:hypothetical protein